MLTQLVIAMIYTFMFARVEIKSSKHLIKLDLGGNSSVHQDKHLQFNPLRLTGNYFLRYN